MRSRPMRYCSPSIADGAHTPVAEVIVSVDFALAVAQVDQRLDDGENVFLRSVRWVSGASSSRRMFI